MKTAYDMFREHGYTVEDSEDFVMFSKGDTIIHVSKDPPITFGKLVRRTDLFPFSVNFIVKFNRDEIMDCAQLIRELEEET